MTSTLPDMPDRRSGIAVWRQIADRLRQEIAAGQPAEGERLPPENTLSERFGVNRHTVRAAIAALVAEKGLAVIRISHDVQEIDAAERILRLTPPAAGEQYESA